MSDQQPDTTKQDADTQSIPFNSRFRPRRNPSSRHEPPPIRKLESTPYEIPLRTHRLAQKETKREPRILRPLGRLGTIPSSVLGLSLDDPCLSAITEPSEASSSAQTNGLSGHSSQLVNHSNILKSGATSQDATTEKSDSNHLPQIDSPNSSASGDPAGAQTNSMNRTSVYESPRSRTGQILPDVDVASFARSGDSHGNEQTDVDMCTSAPNPSRQDSSAAQSTSSFEQHSIDLSIQSPVFPSEALALSSNATHASSTSSPPIASNISRQALVDPAHQEPPDRASQATQDHLQVEPISITTQTKGGLYRRNVGDTTAPFGASTQSRSIEAAAVPSASTMLPNSGSVITPSVSQDASPSVRHESPRQLPDDIQMEFTPTTPQTDAKPAQTNAEGAMELDAQASVGSDSVDMGVDDHHSTTPSNPGLTSDPLSIQDIFSFKPPEQRGNEDTQIDRSQLFFGEPPASAAAFQALASTPPWVPSSSSILPGLHEAASAIKLGPKSRNSGSLLSKVHRRSVFSTLSKEPHSPPIKKSPIVDLPPVPARSKPQNLRKRKRQLGNDYLPPRDDPPPRSLVNPPPIDVTYLALRMNRRFEVGSIQVPRMSLGDFSPQSVHANILFWLFVRRCPPDLRPSLAPLFTTLRNDGAFVVIPNLPKPDPAVSGSPEPASTTPGSVIPADVVPDPVVHEPRVPGLPEPAPTSPGPVLFNPPSGPTTDSPTISDRAKTGLVVSDPPEPPISDSHPRDGATSPALDSPVAQSKQGGGDVPPTFSATKPLLLPETTVIGPDGNIEHEEDTGRGKNEDMGWSPSSSSPSTDYRFSPEPPESPRQPSMRVEHDDDEYIQRSSQPGPPSGFNRPVGSSSVGRPRGSTLGPTNSSSSKEKVADRCEPVSAFSNRPFLLPHKAGSPTENIARFQFDNLSSLLRNTANQSVEQSAALGRSLSALTASDQELHFALHATAKNVQSNTIQQRQLLDLLASTFLGSNQPNPSVNGQSPNTALNSEPKLDPLRRTFNSKIQQYIANLLKCEKGHVVAEVKRYVSPASINDVISGERSLSLDKWCLDWNEDASSDFNDIAIKLAATGFVNMAKTAWKDELPKYASDHTTVVESMRHHANYILEARKLEVAARKVKARKAAGSLPASGGATPGPSSAGPSSGAGPYHVVPAEDSSGPGPDAELEQITKLLVARRRQRKKKLADKRIELVEVTPQLGRHLQIMKKLGRHAASSDESDHDPVKLKRKAGRNKRTSLDGKEITTDTGKAMFTALQPAWRSKELTSFLWDLDTLHQEASSNAELPLGRAPRGNKARIRSHSNKISNSPPPKGLPRNFYDEDWLAKMQPMTQKKVVGQIANTHDLTLPSNLFGKGKSRQR
ncbi:hypothetical protein BDN72DRAFT_905645 [Pluteus cervinus]|uniref:Uncharacterized protein n=1 Tax=Pluteus cervinus TaxID=181527 RepID=A0ACD3A1W5_9AGAR|nr:hypothetical protein BDN72DRAFT_905645 [Pluteus cervinus]